MTDERVEYRVVRDDGAPVSQMVQYQTFEQAKYLLNERRQKGQRPPYRIQRRVVVKQPWEDLDVGALSDGSERP